MDVVEHHVSTVRLELTGEATRLFTLAAQHLGCPLGQTIVYMAALDAYAHFEEEGNREGQDLAADVSAQYLPW